MRVPLLGVVLLCGAAVLASGAPSVGQSAPFTIRPAATGLQMVRVSIGLPRGLVTRARTYRLTDGSVRISAWLRPVGWHTGKGPRSARRAIATFAYHFRSSAPVHFGLVGPGGAASIASPRARVVVQGEKVTVTYGDGRTFNLKLVAPPRESYAVQPATVVEDGPSWYSWRTYQLPDPRWPRDIEVRADALGTVAIVAHLRRDLPGDDYLPDFGWDLDAPAGTPTAGRHLYQSGEPYEFTCGKGGYRVYHPSAALERAGYSEAGPEAGGREAYHYRRAAPGEKVPMQSYAYRTAVVVIQPVAQARLNPTLRYAHRLVQGAAADLPGPLGALARYHRDAIVRTAAVGNDWGNLTYYSDSSDHGGVTGMNRLNHCQAIFAEARQGGDDRLMETAVAWCRNFEELSIWWGPGQTGGTRYNNVQGQGQPIPFGDTSFMWRSNGSVNFCTKGYDSFLEAYEETGDPRMMAALDAQVAYASANVFANRGECRNIGDVRDFLRLYQLTGRQPYLANAVRLFRELRTKLSTGDLFSQGGTPLEADLPFIDDDAVGYVHPFAKPYIIGYALSGLPSLLPLMPNEPKLRDVVSAVSDFMAGSQDPLGGWRYPHPGSTGLMLGQAMEHAWQIVQSDGALGPRPKHLDAVERVLRQRLQVWLRTGKVIDGLGGWEMATGKVKERSEIYKLYATLADRDRSRDYLEGAPGLGGTSPEGLVYFFDVLRFYLRHRPASRLLAPARPDEPLGRLLPRLAIATHQSPGVISDLPAFARAVQGRIAFPLAWRPKSTGTFGEWKRRARAEVMSRLLASPPRAPFSPAVLEEQERGSYTARKILVSLSADTRALAYLLVPKGRGPFPGVLLLHDHGARFDIGKEKVVEPFNDTPARLASSREWVDRYYGGRYVGDELARRGYVCLATDMLNWSDRDGAGFEGQQALASNLFQLGMSWGGLVAHEDLRAAEFLATRPEVDARRVAAMGLSVGGFRTWQVAALSDHIAAGVSICWMATAKGLIVPGNNQTTGQSAFVMTHPGLLDKLDYPDVATLACPKPMLFYGGLRDGLFPVASVREAYARMRQVWASQGAGNRLETRMWDAPHEYNAQMQEAAFRWLDRRFGVGGTPR